MSGPRKCGTRVPVMKDKRLASGQLQPRLFFDFSLSSSPAWRCDLAPRTHQNRFFYESHTVLSHRITVSDADDARDTASRTHTRPAMRSFDYHVRKLGEVLEDVGPN